MHRARCPLWVKSGHSGKSNRCPFYPQKRTWFSARLCSGYINVKRSPPFERVSATVGLRFRETGFLPGRDSSVEKARHIEPIVNRDKVTHENPPIRRYSHGVGKSPFVWNCVVGSGVVPRHSKINDLNCQTALTAPTGAKDISLQCKTEIATSIKCGGVS